MPQTQQKIPLQKKLYKTDPQIADPWKFVDEKNIIKGQNEQDKTVQKSKFVNFTPMYCFYALNIVCIVTYVLVKKLAGDPQK